MKKYIYGLIAFFIVLGFFSSLSAGVYEYKTYDEKTKTVTIADTFLGKIVDFQLVSNTEQCLTDCKAIIKVTPYQSLSLSKNNVKFKLKNWLGKDLKKKDIHVYTETESIISEPQEKTIKYNCVNKSIINSTNGTKTYETVCDTKKEITYVNKTVKTKKELKDVTKNFDKPFDLILEGHKKPMENIEWIPNFLSYDIPEWAWWNSSFLRCRNLNFYQDNSNLARTDEPVEVNLTGLTIDSTNEIRIISAPCGNDGNEVPYQVLDSDASQPAGSDWAEIVTIVNRSTSSNASWSVYYNNTGVEAPSYPDRVVREESANSIKFILDNFGFNLTTGHIWSIDDFEGFNANNAFPIFANAVNSHYWWNSAGGAGDGGSNTTGILREKWTFVDGSETLTAYIYNDRINLRVPYVGEPIRIEFTTIPTTADLIFENSSYEKNHPEDDGEWTDIAPMRNKTLALEDGSNHPVFLVWWNTSSIDTERSIDLSVDRMILDKATTDTTSASIDEPVSMWLTIRNEDNGDLTWSESGMGLEWSEENTYPLNAELGAEETTNSAPTVTLISPTISNYLVNSLVFNFTVTDDSDTSLVCYKNIDGTETSLGSIANGSYYSETIPFGEGSHTVNASCVDSSSKMGSNISTPTIYYWNITAKNYDISNYELENSNFQIDFDKVSNVSINAYLYYDGQNKSYNSTFSNDSIAQISTNVTIGLVSTNDTSKYFGWNYSIVYTNGTTFDSNTDSYSQSIYYSFYPIVANTTSDNILEGNSFNAWTDIGKKKEFDGVKYNVYMDYDGNVFDTSNTVNTSSLERWNGEIDTDLISSYNESKNFHGVLNLSYEGNTYTRNTSSHSITIYKLEIDNCSKHTTNFLNVYFFNETNKGEINQTLEASFEYWNGTTTRNFTSKILNIKNTSFCIYPAWAKFTADGVLEYYSNDYPSRRYYYDNATFDNITDTLNLYALPSSSASLINFEIRDEKGTLVPDVYITVQRYYVSDNQYLTVAMGKTDFDGMTSIYLKKNDVWYKYILIKDGKVLRIFSPSYVTSDSIALTSQVVTYGEWWTYKDNLVYSCYFTNDNQTLVCTMLDTTGTAREGCLKVEEIGAVKNAIKYDSCVEPHSAITFTANLGNTTGKSYHYVLSGNWEGSSHTLLNKNVEFVSKVLTWGMTGILIAFMLFITLSAIGLFSPSASIVLGITSIVLTQVMGLTTISMGGIVGLVVAGMILVFKLRE